MLANTSATCAALFVLITILAPLSGAHFNPAVSLVFAARGEITWRDATFYALFQIAGGVFGAVLASWLLGPHHQDQKIEDEIPGASGVAGSGSR